jgi:hypothetical protein
MGARAWWLWIALWGCGDADRDGVGAGRDCDDAEASVRPGGTEVCDGLDNDCDGHIDEDLAALWYLDADGDGAGDPAVARRVCAQPSNGVATGDDCDDADALRHPGAEEVCDDRDNDCDGAVDDGVGASFSPDGDGDGFGGPGEAVVACVAPEGFAPGSDDCDDGDPAVWTPTAGEACDGLDNDCDGVADDGVAASPWPVDADGDGWGSLTETALACGPGGGVASWAADCDDTDPSVGPQTPERPDGVDQDCDGVVDEVEVPTDYPTVAAALAVASAGDVVQVVGLVEEDVDLRGSGVTLLGEGCGRSVLLGSGAGPVVQADEGEIAGLTVSGGGAGGLVVSGAVLAHDLCVEGNVHDGNGGGVIVAAGGDLTLRDARVHDNTAQGYGEGGGVVVERDAHLAAERVDARGNRAYHGGAIAVRSGRAELSRWVVAGNEVAWDGAGLYVRHNREAGAPPPVVSLERVTVVHNTATGERTNPGGGTSEGPALRVIEDLVAGAGLDAVVSLNRSVIAFSGDFGEPAVWGDYGNISHDGNGFVGNVGRDLRHGWEPDAARGEAGFVFWDPTLPPALWDLRLRASSAFVDADPSALDPDGSPADLGAYGGPGAAGDWDVGLRGDADGDGVLDAWELAWGYRPWVDDAQDDADADGLSLAGEAAAGTRPDRADSDGDGWTDGEEVAAGGEPTRAWDRAPVASLAAPPWWIPGDPIPVDASGSSDPDDIALTYAWTVTPPVGSAGGAWSASGDGRGELVADVPGTWIVEVAVSDGRSTRTAVTTVEVVDAIVVPDDVVRFDVAIAQAPPGGAIALRPGTWVGTVSFTDRDLTVFGLSPDPADVVLQAQGGGSNLRIVDSTVDVGVDLDPYTVSLATLTVQGGDALQGGAIYCRDVDLRLDAVVLAGAEVAGEGGGLYLERCDTVGTDVVVRDTVGRHGGGAYVVGSTMRWIRGAFLGDRATQRGGAIWYGLDDDPQVLELFSTVVQGNVADVDGGAIWYDADDSADLPGKLHHVVFADNRALGSVVRLRDGKVEVVANVFIGNVGATVFDGDGCAETLVAPWIFGNTGTMWDADTAAPAGTVSAPWEALSWVDDGDPSNDLWLARPSSSAIDLGFWEWPDPDGSPAAIGLGGPEALPAWAASAFDADGDGMSDGWESAFGLDDTRDDARSDLDGDGVDNRTEYARGTLPDRADTDGDGVGDGG